MAVSMQSKCFSTRSATVRPRTVRVEAVHGALQKAQVAAVSFAAAALLVVPAADAGVILQQPTLKKAFQDDAPAKVKGAAAPKAVTSAPAAKAEEKKEEKREEGPTSNFGLDPRAIALPGAIGFVGGLAFLASKVDSEFEEFINGTIIKDSNLGQSGLGYEAVIKSTYGGIYGEPTAPGTKKVKAAKKK